MSVQSTLAALDKDWAFLGCNHGGAEENTCSDAAKARLLEKHPLFFKPETAATEYFVVGLPAWS